MWLNSFMKRVVIDSFTDESGQDTKGKIFVVCTVIIPASLTQEISEKLLELENKSGKVKKWFETGNKRRVSYLILLLEERIFQKIEVFYSKYQNKSDYVSLIGAHIAKAIILYSQDKPYLAKVFIDKMDRKTTQNLKKEIKSFRIKYRKIRGLTDQ